MKNILFCLLLLIPVVSFSQSKTIDLTEHGLSATLSNPDGYEYTVETDEDMMTTAIYKIRMDEEEMNVNVLDKSKMTCQKARGSFADILKSARSSKSKATIKMLSQTANAYLMEVTTKATGKKAYWFMCLTSQKGKDIMIDARMDDPAKCKRFFEIAKSIRLK